MSNNFFPHIVPLLPFLPSYENLRRKYFKLGPPDVDVKYQFWKYESKFSLSVKTENHDKLMNFDKNWTRGVKLLI